MEMRKGGASVPPYPFNHSGPCIVAGNAWCLPDDLDKALSLYPKAPIMAVNGAAKEVNAFALYSKHPERLISHRWLYHQRRKFGEATVHGGKPVISCPHVEYWWPDAYGGGGSAWDARKVAHFMGFDLVILCGCPLVPGPYVGGHNLGGFMARRDVVDGFREAIEADAGWHDGAISMSGWTKEILG